MTTAEFEENASHMLNLFSIALVQLEQELQTAGVHPILPLNPVLRDAWEQLCFLCFDSGQLPPRTLPELVAWLHLPVGQWKAIGHYFPSPDWDMPLLEHGLPSALAIRLGSPFADAYNPRLELQDAVFRKIYNLCFELGDADQYTLVREFINRNVVIEDFYAAVSDNPQWRDEISPLLRQCYEAIKPGSIRRDTDGEFVTLCPHCGWVMEWQCGEALCHANGPCAEVIGRLSEYGKRLAYVPGMARTTEGIQRYVAAPEITLIEIVDTLSRLWGMRTTLYPLIDAYDLLIEFGSGKRWAVDVKDHRMAGRLATHLHPFKYEPSWHRAFYVFPNYRADDPAYLNEFGNYYQLREPGVDFMGARAFVTLVKQEASR